LWIERKPAGDSDLIPATWLGFFSVIGWVSNSGIGQIQADGGNLHMGRSFARVRLTATQFGTQMP
jgi:hypothetical protein